MIRFFKDGKEVLKVPPPVDNPIEEEMKKEPSMYGSNQKQTPGLDVMARK